MTENLVLTAKFKVNDVAAATYPDLLKVDTGSSNYYFADADDNTVTPATFPSGGDTFSATVPKAPITSVSAKVDAPQKGVALGTSVNLDGATAYTGAVEWYKGDTATGSAVTGSAAANQVYTAKITLTAKEGESFAASVTAPADYTLGEHDGSKVVLTKTFDATAGADALSGIVSITGTAKFGETLTANTTSLSYGSETSGTLSYQWYRGDTAIGGATSDSYTLAAEDVGQTIKVEVKNSNNTGSVMSDATAAVAKADGPAAPSGLAEVSKTDTTITVTQNSAWEYSKDNGSTWQASNTFTGLTPNTTYSQIVARVKETATHKASAACSAISVTTAKATADSTLKNSLKNAVTAYNAPYDGTAHDAFTVGFLPSGWSAQYADSESGSYSTTMPKVTNVSDSATMWVKFSNSNYSDFVTSYSVSVTAKNISGASITLNTVPTYDGTEKQVTISSVTVDGLTLATSDYDISAGTDKATNVETKTLTITGKGNYTGEATQSWKLQAKDISSVTVTVSGTYTYTGSAITPTYTVTDGSAAVANTNYTAAITDNTNAGTATITLTGKGNYTGTKTETFTIGNAAQTITVPTAEVSVSFGSSLDLSTVCSSNAPGATLTFALKSDFTPPTGTTLSGSIVNAGTEAGTFVVIVDAAAVTNYNAAAQKEFTVKIVNLPAAAVTTAPTAKTGLTYNGTEQTLITAGSGVTGGTLQYKLDGGSYSAALPKAKNAGTYTVYYKVVGDAAHSDSAEQNFTVTVDKKDVTITAGSYKVSKVYDGTTSAGAASGDLAVSGILPADSGVTVQATPAAYTNANVGGQSSMNVSIALNGTGSENYKIKDGATTVSVPCEITKATLTADGTASATADYGTALKNVPITGLTAKLNGVEVAGSWAFSGETILDAGNTTAYTATFTPSTGADNYNTLTSSIVPTINKIAYTGSAITATKNVLTNTAVNGVEVDMTSLLTGIKGAAVSAAAIGTNTEGVLTGTPTVDGNKVKFDVASIAAKDKSATINVTISSTNYTDITATITVTTVDKSDAGVTINGVPASKTYGDADFTLTASVTNAGTGTGVWTWTSSEPTVLEVTGSSAAATVKVLKAGSATITAKYESDTTMGEQTTAPITVSKRVITVTADNKSMTVNGTLPTFTVTYGNLPSGVQAEDIFGTLASASTTTDGKTTGSFDITVTAPVLKTEAGANYEVGAVTKGTLTVNPRSSSGGGGGGSVSTYSVTVGKTENGTISVSPKSASKGDTVTITATPDKGYVLETLTVLDKNDKEIKLTEKNGKYTFTMPASKVTVKATFMDDNTMLNYFVDVKAGDYFYDAVLWAAQKGITSGTDAVHFSPNVSCTRAQIVTFLWRAAGSPEPKGAGSFADVPTDSYYAKAVARAVENGITGGTGDGKFSPDAACTREQAVTFLYRASGSPAVSGGSAFSDVAKNAYYADAVAWAEKNGVTGGIGGGLFGSGNDCTRAQIVTLLYRAYSE